MSKSKKTHREKDLTGRYFSGDFDADDVAKSQRFSRRNADAQQNKIAKTGKMRADEAAAAVDVETLPVGQVVQVYSVYCEVEHEGTRYLCVVRKTLTKLSDTGIVVGDRVRFRAVAGLEAKPNDLSSQASSGQPDGVIEHLFPRETILTRAGSFRRNEQHPIVANAQQMLIVASLREPVVKWGLIDRMLVAAQSGKLTPIVCLNKIDLAENADEDRAFADEALAHYRQLGFATVTTSVERAIGLDEIRQLLRERETVLAGHSGVGKSSLIRAIEPTLDLRIGEVSQFTNKGRHTTTSARRYPLAGSGAVIDTPGVKMFGLWGVTRENLIDFFPDVDAESAPTWRRESYERILASLSE